MFNFWQSLSAEFQAELNQYINHYVTPVQFPRIEEISIHTDQLYRYLTGADATERLFIKWPAGGTTYATWNLYAERPENVQEIRDDFDMLAAEYPNDFAVTGAWRFEDGRPVGMQWVDPDDHSQGLTGTPWYGCPPQIVNFMPDGQLQDVILLEGQTPRVFVDEQGNPWEQPLTAEERALLEWAFARLVFDLDLDPCGPQMAELRALFDRLIDRRTDGV